MAGLDPVPDHVSDAESDDPRLAGSGAGKDQNRPLQGLDRLPLLGVKGTQIQHRARSVGGSAIKARGRRCIVADGGQLAAVAWGWSWPNLLSRITKNPTGTMNNAPRLTVCRRRRCLAQWFHEIQSSPIPDTHGWGGTRCIIPGALSLCGS